MPRRAYGCLTDLGEVARDVVVGLAGIQGGADARLQCRHPGRGGNPRAHDVARGRQVLEGRECVADHGGDIQRAGGVIEGPEGFGTVGIELGELVQLGVGQSRERDQGLIERAQQREGLETGDFQPRPEVGWEGWRTAMAHAARMTR